MNVAIIDVRKGSESRSVKNSYMVAYRNLSVLEKVLNADLYITPDKLRKSTQKYDIVICGFGSQSIDSKVQEEFLTRNKNAILYWLVGEYEQSTFAPLFYCGRQFDVIKNFYHTKNYVRCKDQHFVDINTLLSIQQNDAVKKRFGCCYYGRWREDRQIYFRKYFDKSMVVSTHTKNMKKFMFAGCDPIYMAPFTWTPKKETLNLFRASLYIEDVFTHTHYNCLGNRFYEALFCNCVPLFDSSCINTLKKSWLTDYEWHIVESNKDIARKIIEIDGAVMDRLRAWNEEALKMKDVAINDIKKIIGMNQDCT